jgi:DNA-binding NarL/FixJ family response regulator
MAHSVIRALVVEDDNSWQQILTEILVDAGLVVDVGRNLHDALKIVKAETHRLAIVDLSLAGEDHHNSDGLRVLDAIRHSDPGCQMILLTGYATVDLAVSVLTEHGAFSFLRKENFHRTQFQEIINRALSIPPKVGRDKEDPDEKDGVLSLKVAGILKGKDNEILVVEDDAGWRSIISELLTDAGYSVTLSTSFGDALGHIRRKKFDLAIMDLSLSTEVSSWQDEPNEHLEGIELLTSTRIAGMPTIIVSGVASMSEIQQIYSEHSIFAFLEKQSFDRTVFTHLVEEALRSRQGGSELSSLTDREKEVLFALASGMTNKEMAEKLVITTNTVKRHLKAIFEKLDVHTRSAAAAKAVGNRH